MHFVETLPHYRTEVALLQSSFLKGFSSLMDRVVKASCSQRSGQYSIAHTTEQTKGSYGSKVVQ